MNQKTVIVVIIAGVPEVYGSFKKFCQTKEIPYQTKHTPKLKKPLIISGYEVHKVEAL